MPVETTGLAPNHPDYPRSGNRKVVTARPGAVPGSGRHDRRLPPKPPRNGALPYRMFMTMIDWVFALILLPFLFVFSVLMWIPWTWFSGCRPALYNAGGEKSKRKYIAGDDYTREEEYRDVFALPGQGIEKRWPNGRRFWPFIKGRTWQFYEICREAWRSVHRQGLQIGGMATGAIIILDQVLMIAHDYNSESITTFQDSMFGGENSENASDAINSDKLCAYAVGTGIANWGGDSLENLVWYGFWHGFLIVFCLMLMGDEFVNVRMGLFAPQWSRAGTGWSIMFIIRLRYAVMVSIFLFGVYNVLRTLIVSMGLTDHRFADATYRNRRHPLRGWTEPQWKFGKLIQDFRGRNENEKAQYLSERLQFKIGDHCWLYQKVDRKKMNYGIPQNGQRKVCIKTRAEYENELGKTPRTAVHGWPITLPDLSAEDKVNILSGSYYKGEADYYGLPNWDPWAKWRNPKDAKQATRFKMERSGWVFQRNATYWFALRRVHAVSCALSAVMVHIGLMVDTMGRSHWKGYRGEYEAASDLWKEHHGPTDGECQYYQGTHMPIFPQVGTGSFRGVFANMFWLGLWHYFMIGLCLGAALVAFSNHRYFGQHTFMWITLVGPRLSSNSIGWTLGVVAWGTLQTGLFAAQPGIVQIIARFVLYNCIASWVLHIAPNYHMGNGRILQTFWFRLSEMAFYIMDRKQFHRQVYDYATF